jgi:hypothetical protein
MVLKIPILSPIHSENPNCTFFAGKIWDLTMFRGRDESFKLNILEVDNYG